MARSAWSTRFLLIVLFSSLTIVLCSASEHPVAADNLNFPLISQKTSMSNKTTTLLNKGLSAIVSVGSLLAIFDAFSGDNSKKKVIQGGFGIVALLASLYNLGFFEAGEATDSYDCCDHEYCHGCHSHYDSCYGCSCHDCFSYRHDDDSFSYKQDERGCKVNNTTEIKTITVETVSNDVMCNTALVDFWEDPINY